LGTGGGGGAQGFRGRHGTVWKSGGSKKTEGLSNGPGPLNPLKISVKGNVKKRTQ